MYGVFSPVINDRYLEGKLFYLLFMHIKLILISKIRKTSLIEDKVKLNENNFICRAIRCFYE